MSFRKLINCPIRSSIGQGWRHWAKKEKKISLQTEKIYFVCDSSLQEQYHLPFTPLCINIVAAGVQVSEPLSASILFHQTALFLILVYLFNLLLLLGARHRLYLYICLHKCTCEYQNWIICSLTTVLMVNIFPMSVGDHFKLVTVLIVQILINLQLIYLF